MGNESLGRNIRVGRLWGGVTDVWENVNYTSVSKGFQTASPRSKVESTGVNQGIWSKATTKD